MVGIKSDLGLFSFEEIEEVIFNILIDKNISVDNGFSDALIKAFLEVKNGRR